MFITRDFWKDNDDLSHVGFSKPYDVKTKVKRVL